MSKRATLIFYSHHLLQSSYLALNFKENYLFEATSTVGIHSHSPKKSSSRKLYYIETQSSILLHELLFIKRAGKVIC